MIRAAVAQLTLLSALVFTMFHASQAMAQMATTTSTSSPGNIQVQFNGTVSTTVMLTVSGGVGTTLSGTSSSLNPTAALGTIALGTFNTQTPTIGLTNASGYRINAGTPGALVAAEVNAVLLYNGSPTGTILVKRKVASGGAGDVPLVNLRVASPSLGSWTAGTDGTQVPDATDPGLDICVAAGDATCINDKPYPHQIAVFVPDNQTFGAFSTTVVYTATSP